MKYMKKKTGVTAAASSEHCVNGAYLAPDFKNQSTYRAVSRYFATGIKAFSKIMAPLLFVALILTVTNNLAIAQTPTFNLSTGILDDIGDTCTTSSLCVVDNVSVPHILTVNDGVNIEVTGNSSNWRIEVYGSVSIILRNATISTSLSPITIDSGGSLTLTLTGNNTLEAAENIYAGIQLLSSTSNLTINATTTAGVVGRLTVNGGLNGAGIGGGQSGAGGNITINSGTINTTGGDGGGAGIGGGKSGAGGVITINSGTITAMGGVDGGAGIGGGNGGDGGNIAINGGTINATGGETGAGIGGGAGSDGGAIAIEGGKINAEGGLYGGAGIGGGQNGDGGAININGGTIDATGGVTGAGIGGGLGASSGAINISGGTINAVGGTNGAGIGGGQNGDASLISIIGGTIGAKGGSLGAGIGGGQNGAGGNITINGGYITATAVSAYTMGIGQGFGGADGTFTMDGDAVVVASSINDLSLIPNKGILFIDSGVKYDGMMFGDEVTLTDNASFPDGGEITIFSQVVGQELIIPLNVALTNYAKITIAGKITIEGELINYGEIVNLGEIEIAADGSLKNTEDGAINNDSAIIIDGKLVNDGAITNNVGGQMEITGDGELTNNENGLITNDGDVTIDGKLINNGTIYNNGTVDGTITGNQPAVQMEYIYFDEPNNSKGYRWAYSGNVYTLLDDAYVTISGTSTNRRIQVYSGANVNITLNNAVINIPSVSPISLDTGANVTLTLIGDNYLSNYGSPRDEAGIRVPYGTTLTITAESNGGALTISAGSGAGIGGSRGIEGGTITIYGGTIVSSATNGAGIGGGLNGAGATVFIYGGNITAISSSGAGIGSGNGSSTAGAFSMDGNAVVFASPSVSDTSAKEKGILFIGTSGTVYGNMELEENLTIPIGYTLTVPAGVIFTIPAGVTLTNEGAIINNGAIRILGTLINNSTITDNGKIDGIVTNNQPNHGTDPTIPTVLSVTPGGADVSINGSLMITFNEAMNTATAGTVQLNSLTALTGGSWSADNTVFTIPYNSLAFGVLYTINISGFKSATGGAMAASGSYSFTTSTWPDTTPPTVLSVTPVGAGAAINGNLVITFNEAMDATMFGTVRLNNLAALMGGSWSGGNTVFSIPYGSLTYNTLYTVSVSDFKDASGNTMAPSSSHSFMTAATPDAVTPTVLSVTPVGTGAPINGSLMITFSKVMNTASAGTVRLNSLTALTGGSWSGGNTILSIPYGSLTYNTLYALSVSDFKDASGNTMAPSSSHSFMTAATPDAVTPMVLSVTPSGSEVSINGSLMITFSKAMDTATTGTVQLNSLAALTGGSWSNGNSIFSIPYSGLAYGVLHTINISGFKDTTGSTITASGSFSFTTSTMPDTTPPTVLSVTPSGAGAPINGNLVITFNEAMDATMFGTVRLNSLAALTGGSWSGGNTVFTIPYDGLTYDTVHTVNVSDFKDASGNTMTASGGNSFTTAAAPDTTAPTVLSVTPTGTGAPISGNLVITFNEPMDTTTVGTIRLDGFITLAGGSWSGGNAVFTIPYRDLVFGKLYTINISGFNDASGNTMAVSGNYNFTTGSAPILAGIPRLAFEVNQQGPVFVNVSGLDFNISNDGNGHFSATITGFTNYLTIYGVQYNFYYVPEGLRPGLVIEKNGSETPLLDVYGTESSPNLYYSTSEVTLNHGDRIVYKLYVGDILAGSFTVVYINEPLVITKPVTQVKSARSYWFAPVELYGTDFKYEIISRPNTLGGLAPWIDNEGRFAFAQQVMPLNISRAGVYMIKATDKSSNGIEVFKIEIK